MTIPKYVKDLMSRARFFDDDETIGYCIAINKSTPYAKAETLKEEVERLCNWCNRQTKGIETAQILSTPTYTHYRKQEAIVRIFDPVMQHLEVFIKE